MSTRVGLEPVHGSADAASNFGQSAGSRAAESGAVETPKHPEAAEGAATAAGPDDPDLARFIAIWPTLPGDVKAGIVAMVQNAADHTNERRG